MSLKMKQRRKMNTQIEYTLYALSYLTLLSSDNVVIIFVRIRGN